MTSADSATSTNEKIAERQRNRVRASVLTLVILAAVILGPQVYRLVSSFRVKYAVARDTARMLGGETDVRLDSALEQLIVRPSWADYVGGTDFGGSNEGAVLGLKTSRSLSVAARDYLAEMKQAGWRLQKVDEGTQSYLLYLDEPKAQADIMFQQVDAESVVFVVNVQRR